LDFKDLRAGKVNKENFKSIKKVKMFISWLFNIVPMAWIDQNWMNNSDLKSTASISKPPRGIAKHGIVSFGEDRKLWSKNYSPQIGIRMYSQHYYDYTLKCEIPNRQTLLKRCLRKNKSTVRGRDYADRLDSIDLENLDYYYNHGNYQDRMVANKFSTGCLAMLTADRLINNYVDRNQDEDEEGAFWLDDDDIAEIYATAVEYDYDFSQFDGALHPHADRESYDDEELVTTIEKIELYGEDRDTNI